ncbi:MAG TPA: NAD(P)H-dependent oxidoreductase [Sphingobium sp.]
MKEDGRLTNPTSSRRALIVHAHSEKDSFVSAMRDTVHNELVRAGYDVLESDLYAMGFNPVLSPSDFPERKNPEHLVYALEQRHGYETETLPDDIMLEIHKVLDADLIIFTFPVFWFSVPAILKGWIDRVFISGPFYGGRRIYGQGGLRGKRALAVLSLGGRAHMFGPGSLHGELESGMLKHFFQGSLGYVGFDVIEPFIAFHAPYLDQDTRSKILSDLGTYIGNVENLASLPLPDLNAFDANFTPLPRP